MDHKEQHHQHHRKEREEKIEHQKQHDRTEEKKDPWPFHPIWLVVFGSAMVLIALAVWIWVLS